MGKFYEAQQVSNYRTNSVDYLQSMIGLAEIDLQELELKEEVENVNVIKNDAKINLIDNLEFKTNLP